MDNELSEIEKAGHGRMVAYVWRETDGSSLSSAATFLNGAACCNADVELAAEFELLWRLAELKADIAAGVTP